MTHRHKVSSSTDRAFAGSVTNETEGYYRQNEAAHGNIVRIEWCACGAERRTNINQRHVERGRWSESD